MISKPKTTKPLYSNFRGVQIVEVLKVVVNEGEGVEGDPIVRTTYSYTKDGYLIGHNDHKTRLLVPDTGTYHDK